MAKTVNGNETLYDFTVTKRNMLLEFIDSMSDDELYILWSECAADGRVEYIELTDNIDEVFTASKILEMDIEDFNIRDDYYRRTLDSSRTLR